MGECEKRTIKWCAHLIECVRVIKNDFSLLTFSMERRFFGIPTTFTMTPMPPTTTTTTAAAAIHFLSTFNYALVWMRNVFQLQ